MEVNVTYICNIISICKYKLYLNFNKKIKQLNNIDIKTLNYKIRTTRNIVNILFAGQVWEHIVQNHNKDKLFLI